MDSVTPDNPQASHTPVPLKLLLTKPILAEIERIGRRRAPSEACGLVLPLPGDTSRRSGIAARVIELPNRSMSPRDEYELRGSDIELALEHWMGRDDVTQDHVDSMVVWHTHPNGQVGPSRGDLDYKPGGLSMIVVTLLPERGYVHTLF